MLNKTFPRYAAYQHNSDGRPCGWGSAPNKEDAIRVAEEMYESHNCYPNEEKGKMKVFLFKNEDDKGTEVSLGK